MKRAIAIFWLISFLATPVINFISITDYALRYSYYAKVLCENKDKPAMHCNGKCHLAQSLKTQSQPTEPTLPTIIEFRVIAVAQDSETRFGDFSESAIVKQYPPYSLAYLPEVNPEVQTPPPKIC